ncbi:tetratricopeptide repeat protein [Virgibacillus xinjiangensis]|uniref:Tetratricopeptide repeat protein n=1 Tax=Virgibacillus xinjiangensis TaxID=393090 RepID=A0ABV7CY58_9BACI
MQHVEKKREGENKIIPFIPEGDFYFTKGVEAFQKRKFDIAEKWLKKAMEAKPFEPLYACQLSVVYTETGNYHKANQLLTNVLQVSEYIDCYYLIANNYAHLGLLNDARKHANIYLEKEPEGDFSEEAKSLLEMIDIDEDDTDDDNWDLEEEDDLLIYQETIFYHMENREWEQALPLIEDMMLIFPEHKTAIHDHAHALFFTGEEERAVEIEQQTILDDPNNLYSHTNLALFYHQLEREEDSRHHINVLLNVYPIHQQQKLRIAVTLARTGYYKEAYQRFRPLVKNQMKSHLSYFHWYSVAAYRVGEPAKALSLWEEGCKRHPKLSKEEGPWK